LLIRRSEEFVERCAQCGEPATAFAYSGNPPEVSAALCFVHAADSGLGAPAPHWLVGVAEDAGLSTNSVFFIWCSFRARARLCRNAMGCCLAVWQEATERFGEEAGDALQSMGIGSGHEVSKALHALLRAGAERLAEGERLEDFAGLETIGAFP
jgi:hypothetical protein